MPESYRPSVKGISIRTVNLVMLALSMALFCIVLYTTVQIAGEYRKNVSSTEKYINLQQSAHLVHAGSDYLTEEVRLYAATHRLEHVANYFDELYSYRNREKALDFIKGENLNPEHQKWLEKALELSNRLTRREIYSIRLTAEATHQNLSMFPKGVQDTRLTEADSRLDDKGKIELARSLVFNPEYSEAKQEIYSSIGKFLDQTLERTHREQKIQSQKLGEVLAEQRVVLIGLCLLNVLTFLMIIVLIVKPLQVYLKCIKNDKMIELVGAYEFRHLALTYNDIFAMKEHHGRLLRHQAEHDQLTGLFNRSAFEKFRTLLQMESAPVGLILIDVDHFKEINDTFGHKIGDWSLRRVADLIKQSFRADDFCIRLGGDEFAVIVKGNPEILRETIPEKIKNMNNALSTPSGDLPPTSLSVGIAFSNSGFSDSLYEKADSALYRVKERGRRGYAIYDEPQAGRPA